MSTERPNDCQGSKQGFLCRYSTGPLCDINNRLL